MSLLQILPWTFAAALSPLFPSITPLWLSLNVKIGSKHSSFMSLFLIVCLERQLRISSIFSGSINISVNIITIAINCPHADLTHTRSLPWVSSSTLPTARRMCGWGAVKCETEPRRRERPLWCEESRVSVALQPCLDPGKSEMQGGMVGDKSTSASSMGHFSTGAALTLRTVCVPVMTERERETLINSTKIFKFD